MVVANMQTVRLQHQTRSGSSGEAIPEESRTCVADSPVIASALAETYRVDFVLTRGPDNVARRFTVTVPTDGTPVSLGRSPQSAVVLDPWLIFASQTHCSVFAVADACAPQEDATVVTKTPVRRRPIPHVFITDLCSSNGTFVNGTRISSADPQKLCDGDECIFGGMRDVAVGDTLPANAYAGPELTLWRVVLSDPDAVVDAAPSAVQQNVERTPLILPSAEVLNGGPRDLLETAWHYLRTPQGTEARRPSIRTEPTANTPKDAAVGPPRALFGSPLSESRGRPSDVLSWGRTPAVETMAVPPPPAPSAPREGMEPMDTITAPETEDGEASTKDAVATPERGDDGRPTEPMSLPTAGAVALTTPRPAPGVPPPVYYHAVRVGAQTFTVPDECLVATRRMQQPSESGEELSHDEATAPAKKKCRQGHPLRQCEVTGIVSPKVEPPHHALRLTHSHCCWQMAALPAAGKASVGCPVGEGAYRSSNFLVPLTAIGSVFVCLERLGVAVELKQGATIPRLPEGLLQGGAENRWLVWLLEEHQSGGSSTEAHPAQGPKRKGHKRGHAAIIHGRAEAPAWDADRVEATAGFAAWCTLLTIFCEAYHVATPLRVEAEVFDELYAPSHGN